MTSEFGQPIPLPVDQDMNNYDEEENGNVVSDWWRCSEAFREEATQRCKEAGLENIRFGALPQQTEDDSDKKGTLGLAFIFKQGAMVAIDHHPRATTTGPNPLPKNLFEMNDRTLCFISGAGGELSDEKRAVISKELEKEFELRELFVPDTDEDTFFLCVEEPKTEEEPPAYLQLAAEAAAVALSRDHKGLSAVVLGWDKMGPGLYSVDGEGKMSIEDVLVFGSGSGFAHGYIRPDYKFNMSFDEAKMMAARALSNAALMARESGASGQIGGYFSVYYVGRDGFHMVYEDESAAEFLRQLELERNSSTPSVLKFSSTFDYYRDMDRILLGS